MDISNLATQLGAIFGMQPSTLILFIFIINQASRVIARRIPDDATGFWGFVRQTCAILGAEVDSKLTAGTTVKDVAKAALDTPPVAKKVEAQAKEEAAE